MPSAPPHRGDRQPNNCSFTTGFDIAGMINSNIFGEATVANYSDSLPGSEKALKPFS